MPDTKTSDATDYEARVRSSFAKQGLMAHLGATIKDIRTGYCEITMPFREELSQQHGFFHAGGLSAIVDTAGGYAGLTMFDEDEGVLTVEFKVNLMAPAVGEELVARGEVIKSGRSLTITKGDVFAVKDGQETLVAVMQQTLMRIVGRADVKG